MVNETSSKMQRCFDTVFP